MPSEFSLIKRYFDWHQHHTDTNEFVVGVGDDAAVLRIPDGYELVVTVDTLIAGVHFPIQTDPHAIGHKALAVNLSDLAAMGAQAKWFTLALSLPKADETWLSHFSQGLAQLAQKHNVKLIGGDTTKGDLSMSLQAMGIVPQGQALLRSGACVGDGIYVTGFPGEAGIGLQSLLQSEHFGLPLSVIETMQQRLNYPTPRLAIGERLRNIASACLDISDGLLADLQHILEMSQVGARLDFSHYDLGSGLSQLPKSQAMTSVLTAGDDYELLFTVPSEREKDLKTAMQVCDLSYQRIGEIITLPYKVVLADDLRNLLANQQGYNHFA